MSKCKITECNKERKNKDVYCSMHRARFYRTGQFDLIKRDTLFDHITKEVNGCWTFNLATRTNGYGRLRVKNLKILAHRLMWLRTFGVIPDGLEVCHTCDNRACVNPDHLFLGTHLENMQDMVKKGRSSCKQGEKNGHSILSENQVKEIYRLCKSGHAQRKIANQFGVTQSAVMTIMTGRTWKHLKLKGKE